MKAVIMAGGFGTRLRPLTYEMAKPSMPIAGKPCIYHVIRGLVKSGIKDIIITSGYRVEDIMRTVGSFAEDLGINVIYSYEYTPRGTAGGVKKVQAFLDDTFIVASGDVLSHVDFADIVRYHREKKAMATMALTRIDNPTEYGIVGLDEDGRIVRFKEKPKPDEVFSNLINAGIYVLEPDVLDFIPPNTMFDFSKNTFPLLLEKGKRLFGIELRGLWKDIGRPHDLLDANRLMCLELVEEVKSDAFVINDGGEIETTAISGGIYIGKGARIEEGAVVENAYIMDGVRVGKGAIVRNSLIMEGSIIEEDALVEDTILLRNVNIGQGASLKNCMLGSDVSVLEGSKLSDVRTWEKNLAGMIR